MRKLINEATHVDESDCYGYQHHEDKHAIEYLRYNRSYGCCRNRVS